jgi:hypothetical protein
LVKTKLDHKVREALENYFRSREKKSPFSAHDIAAGFLAAESELIQQWNLAVFQNMIRSLVSEIAKPAKPQPYQMFLPGFRGDLAERIRIEMPPENEDERPKLLRKPLGNATISDLRENVRLLKQAASQSPKIRLREQLPLRVSKP